MENQEKHIKNQNYEKHESPAKNQKTGKCEYPILIVSCKGLTTKF